jgi:hypothetical protein
VILINFKKLSGYLFIFVARADYYMNVNVYDTFPIIVTDSRITSVGSFWVIMFRPSAGSLPLHRY